LINYFNVVYNFILLSMFFLARSADKEEAPQRGATTARDKKPKKRQTGEERAPATRGATKGQEPTRRDNGAARPRAAVVVGFKYLLKYKCISD
jgi:hypothetical protein